MCATNTVQQQTPAHGEDVRKWYRLIPAACIFSKRHENVNGAQILMTQSMMKKHSEEQLEQIKTTWEMTQSMLMKLEEEKSQQPTLERRAVRTTSQSPADSIQIMALQLELKKVEAERVSAMERARSDAEMERERLRMHNSLESDKLVHRAQITQWMHQQSGPQPWWQQQSYHQPWRPGPQPWWQQNDPQPWQQYGSQYGPQ